MRQSQLEQTDPAVFKLIKEEEERQSNKLSMIPSENFFSPSVREAVGSIFMHKYSEGNIDNRYYEGNEVIDSLESLAIERAKKFFSVPSDWTANVQALSGSNANLAVYLAVMEPGDTMLGMYLPDGGHLSHGWSYAPRQTQNPNNPVYLRGERQVHITSKMYRTIQYKTNPRTQRFDYDTVEAIAQKYSPQLIITGGTAYPRKIDYKRMKNIAEEVGALYLADIAHEAGLIGTGVLESPIGIADIVTFTTHKTLRSGRGAIILANKSLMTKINRAVLPGLQGGPHNHNIAGIATGLGEALKPEFKKYAKQVVVNANHLAKELLQYDFELVSGGTDKHLILINMTNKGILGKYTSRAMDYAGIVLNMNTMPGEKRSPSDPSAIRLGTPWVTTRGMKKKEMELIASWINDVVEEIRPWADLEFDQFETKVESSEKISKIALQVEKLCSQFSQSF